MIKCICINDRHRPPQIPETHWLKFGQEYTVESIYELVQPGAVLGVTLSEIRLDELNTPFHCFQIGRFGFAEEDLPALMQLIENCKGLQTFDPMKLIEDEVLTGKHLDDFEDYHQPDDIDKDLSDL